MATNIRPDIVDQASFGFGTVTLTGTNATTGETVRQMAEFDYWCP